MTDLEKVIEGLEEVIAEAVYPDRPRKFMMSLELAEDALALLKAQEPRVMTLGEWREWKRKPLSQRDPVYYVDNKGLGSWIAPNDQLFIYATPELGYGVLFVCWTSRPSDEQRQAVKWE